MSHPLIPPNCEFFGLYPDGRYYFDLINTGKFPLDDEVLWKNNSQLRILCASVARCSWHAEDEKIWHSKKWLSDPSDFSNLRCRENEKLWEQWGNRK